MSTSTTINRRPLDGHDLFDGITEQLERLENMHYMIDSLGKELHVLREITGRDDVYFKSAFNCLSILEQLSFDNLANLKQKESRVLERLKGEAIGGKHDITS